MDLNKVCVLLGLILCIHVCESNALLYNKTVNVMATRIELHAYILLAFHFLQLDPYYPNLSATVGTPIICCGDVELNPGPNVDLNRKPVHRLTGELRYSRDALLDIGATCKNCAISQSTLQIIKELRLQ